MEAGGSPAVAVQKPTLTPKAIIYKRFGNSACYKVEEMQESTETGCPGLSISQKGPCLYRCSLQLPEISVVSGAFKKKKEAEQSAAELALEKVCFIFISVKVCFIFISVFTSMLYCLTWVVEFSDYL